LHISRSQDSRPFHVRLGVLVYYGIEYLISDTKERIVNLKVSEYGQTYHIFLEGCFEFAFNTHRFGSFVDVFQHSNAVWRVLGNDHLAIILPIRRTDCKSLYRSVIETFKKRWTGPLHTNSQKVSRGCIGMEDFCARLTLTPQYCRKVWHCDSTFTVWDNEDRLSHQVRR